MTSSEPSPPVTLLFSRPDNPWLPVVLCQLAGRGGLRLVLPECEPACRQFFAGLLAHLQGAELAPAHSAGPLPEQPPGSVCLVVPEAFQISDADPEITLDPWTEQCLSQAADQQLELAESLQLELLGHCARVGALAASPRSLAQRLLSTQQAFEPELFLAWLYHIAQVQGPAGHEQARAPIEAAIEAAIAGSAEAGPASARAQLALLLYGRRLQSPTLAGLDLPELPAAGIATHYLTPWNYRLLEILPPVRDYRITIYMPTYNRVELLKRSVQTILDQQYQDWLLLIGDDGSSDGTAEFCTELQAREPERVRYIRKAQNSGQVDTVQMLLAQVETELVLSFSDDHFLEPDFLQQVMTQYRRWPWVAYVAGSLRIRFTHNQELLLHGPFYPEACVVDNRKELQRCGIICPSGPAVVYRLNLLKHFGNEDIWFCNQNPEGIGAWDYLMNNKLLAHYEVAYFPAFGLTMEDAPNTASRQKDSSYEMLYLLQILIGDYNSLYHGARFPLALVKRYVDIYSYLQKERLGRILNEAPSPEQARQEIEVALTSWQKLVELRLMQSSAASASEPLLFQPQNPYR